MIKEKLPDMKPFDEIFPHYLITDYGKLFNNKTKRWLQGTTQKGYTRFTLRDKTIQNRINFWYAQRAVYTAWKGIIPDGMEIHHINGIRDDNRISNLECVTPEENKDYRFN